MRLAVAATNTLGVRVRSLCAPVAHTLPACDMVACPFGLVTWPHTHRSEWVGIISGLVGGLLAHVASVGSKFISLLPKVERF